MRQVGSLVIVAAAALFLGIAIPGSPLARGIVAIVSGTWTGTTASRAQPLGGGPDAQAPVFRAAVAAMVSPQRTYEEYRHLFEGVADHLGLRLEFVQRRTYAEINEMLATGALDMAWICTGAVPDLERRGGAEIVARPRVNGKLRYRALLVVRERMAAGSPLDLQGRRMAFTDPLSLTGRWVVVDWLQDKGHDAGAFFGSTFYTHGHDLSLQAVKRGLADAATVDSLVWDYLSRREPASILGLRVAWRSRAFPNPPIAVSHSAAESFGEKIPEILFKLGDSADLRRSLNRIGVDGLVRAGAEDYRGLEDVVPPGS